MKNRNLYRTLQGVVMVLLLAGCSQETVIAPDTRTGGEMQIKLTPDFAREVEVKSLTNPDETSIYSVWVIQLKGDNVLTGTDGNRLAERFSREDLKDGEEGSKLITTSIDVTADKVYFIANVPESVSFSDVTTKSDIEEKSVEVLGESSLAGAGGIVMSGAWKAGGSTSITEGVDLHRAVAKVTLNL